MKTKKQAESAWDSQFPPNDKIVAMNPKKIMQINYLSSKNYAFVSNEGKVRHFDGKTTIPELLAMGVTKIGFVPIGSPPEDRNIYVHSSNERPCAGTAGDARLA